ncbi:hypothetical protein RyT2_14210 [Pseudolactococcus yaeyamensis]
MITIKKIASMATLMLSCLALSGVATPVHADEVADKAYQVIRGDFGNGQTRKDKLGKDYSRIQKKVNELLNQASVPVPETDKAQNTPAPNDQSFSSVSVSAQTQYSHTTTDHYEGQYYVIPSSIPEVVKNASGTTVTGTISRPGIGLEKGTISLFYVLDFDAKGGYVSGTVTSSGYVDASITLTVGQSYVGQTVNFLTTTGGNANSGSYIYPISVSMTMN